MDLQAYSEEDQQLAFKPLKDPLLKALSELLKGSLEPFRAWLSRGCGGRQGRLGSVVR